MSPALSEALWGVWKTTECCPCPWGSQALLNRDENTVAHLNVGLSWGFASGHRLEKCSQTHFMDLCGCGRKGLRPGWEGEKAEQKKLNCSEQKVMQVWCFLLPICETETLKAGKGRNETQRRWGEGLWGWAGWGAESQQPWGWWGLKTLGKWGPLMWLKEPRTFKAYDVRLQGPEAGVHMCLGNGKLAAALQNKSSCDRVAVRRDGK